MFINKYININERCRIEDIINEDQIEDDNKNILLIRESGVYTLLLQTIDDNKMEFNKWLGQDLLPEIREFKREKIEYIHKDFYENNLIATYDKKKVLYIGYIGKYKGVPLFKYGLQKLIIFVYIDFIININDLVVTPRVRHMMYMTEI